MMNRNQICLGQEGAQMSSSSDKETTKIKQGHKTENNIKRFITQKIQQLEASQKVFEIPSLCIHARLTLTLHELENILKNNNRFSPCRSSDGNSCNKSISESRTSWQATNKNYEAIHLMILKAVLRYHHAQFIYLQMSYPESRVRQYRCKTEPHIVKTTFGTDVHIIEHLGIWYSISVGSIVSKVSII